MEIRRVIVDDVLVQFLLHVAKGIVRKPRTEVVFEVIVVSIGEPHGNAVCSDGTGVGQRVIEGSAVPMFGKLNQHMAGNRDQERNHHDDRGCSMAHQQED